MSGLNSGMPKKPVPPSCEQCGHGTCTPIRKPGVSDEQIAQTGGLGSFFWLCGDCLYKREHPDAEPAVKMPRERTVALQEERLFNL